MTIEKLRELLKTNAPLIYNSIKQKTYSSTSKDNMNTFDIVCDIDKKTKKVDNDVELPF